MRACHPCGIHRLRWCWLRSQIHIQPHLQYSPVARANESWVVLMSGDPVKVRFEALFTAYVDQAHDLGDNVLARVWTRVPDNVQGWLVVWEDIDVTVEEWVFNGHPESQGESGHFSNVNVVFCCGAGRCMPAYYPIGMWRAEVSYFGASSILIRREVLRGEYSSHAKKADSRNAGGHCRQSAGWANRVDRNWGEKVTIRGTRPLNVPTEAVWKCS